MIDTMTREQRHRCMSHIRAKAKPEMIVRRFLWLYGYRYGLHSKKMSGHPDIVLRKYKTVVFINGCFWYGHNAEALEVGEHTNSDCCKIPNTNRSFRLDKINRNRERDVETTSALQAKVWRVITLWECDLKPKRRETTLNRLLDLLSPMKQCEICNATISIGAESDAIYVKQNNDYETNQ